MELSTWIVPSHVMAQEGTWRLRRDRHSQRLWKRDSTGAAPYSACTCTRVKILKVCWKLLLLFVVTWCGVMGWVVVQPNPRGVPWALLNPFLDERSPAGKVHAALQPGESYGCVQNYGNVASGTVISYKSSGSADLKGLTCTCGQLYPPLQPFSLFETGVHAQQIFNPFSVVFSSQLCILHVLARPTGQEAMT